MLWQWVGLGVGMGCVVGSVCGSVVGLILWVVCMEGGRIYIYDCI